MRGESGVCPMKGASGVCPMRAGGCPVASKKAPVRVCITGAAGQIAYSLIIQISSGRMLGPDQPVILQLLEIPPAEGALKGVVMEIEDCAFPLVHSIVATVDPKVGFKDADVAIFVGAFPRKQGMERKDLLEKNASIFDSQGKILAAVASKNVKVLVVGNPANTNCLLLMRSAGSIPAENFSCLTRLDHNRAKAQIAGKVGVHVSSVHNVIIWGNHSATQYPDARYAVVKGFPAQGIDSSAVAAVNDQAWLQQTFIPTVQKRGAAIIAARKLSSAASAANAIVEHVRDWMAGTAPGEIVSMGVVSDGSYGIPKGLIFSFPVTCAAGGHYQIVQGLSIDNFSQEKIAATTKELEKERDTAVAYVSR